MATSTTRLGLSKPDGSDVVDIAVLNANSDKLDIAAGAYICTSSTRPTTPWNGQFIYETDTFTALVYKSSTSTWSPLGGSTVGPTPPTGASKGDLWWDSDTGRLYVYYVDANSSQWVAASNSSTNTVGLVPVVAPTIAISGGTATANTAGTVSFSGVTSIRLDNVFTSAYKNYLIKYSIKCSATSDIRHQLVSAGTVNTTAAYNNSGPAWITNSMSSFNNSAGNNWMLSVSTGAGDDMTAADIQLFNPAIATRTSVVASSAGHDGTNTKHFWSNGVHTLATAYDGFYIFPVSGNLSGTLTVYGYNS